ncbi:30S ribosomal protein S5 [Patescibacteria group bacterium]|nr:30S ribosomal protein S5 [Patescibacteria group bacterium]
MAFKGKGKPKFKREKPEFDQQIVDLARVTRVTKGGKQLSFRALVVIGDRKGRVGYGVDKGKDVQIAVEKSVNQAKKNMITIPLIKGTVPHRVEAKYKAAKVLVKPAPKGSGIIAGGAVRLVLELGGVPNASAKILGKTNNKMNNVKATFLALQSFKSKAKKKEYKKDIKTENAERVIVNSEEETFKVEDKK